jgi:DNA polymerase-3 subunit alpha
MSYSLIETYGSTTETVMVDHRTYPANSLLEDDLGIRWYVTDSLLHISAPFWARAAAAGAGALAAPLHSGGWAAIATERFMDLRSEDRGFYSLIRGWSEFPSFPDYTDLLDAADAMPGAATGFVHLHTHSEYSPMDGRSRLTEVISEVVKHGQSAVSLNDHGVCSGHPTLQRECEAAGIKPIFGMEAYFQDDRFRRMAEWWETEDGRRVSDSDLADMTLEQRKKNLVRKTDFSEAMYGYWHLTLLAIDDQGLRNLWAISTEGFRDGLYGKFPRIDWDTLERHSEGIIVLSGCLRGPLAVPVIEDDEALARERLARLRGIFGDRFYLEVMPNDLPEQKKVNEAMVAFGREHGVPLVATVDSHYPTAEHRHEHKAWVAANTNTDVQDETDLFAHDLGLYVKSEAEVRAGLAYLGFEAVDEAVASTARIADRCTAHIEHRVLMPVYSKVGGEERDVERLLDLCLSNWHRVTNKSYSLDDAMARFEREMALLISKRYCGYYLQVADYVTSAKGAGCLVGPGRGSGGGSIVAYLAGITDLDPIEGGLLFERFLTEGRDSPPDFDVDFPTSWRPWVQDYITDKYGAERVVRVGTHLRLKNKGIIKDLGRAMKSQLPETAWADLEKVSKIITEAEASTAGLGLSWDALWAQEGDLLEPYAAKYPELFDMAERLVGILKSYGKHAAGLVVSTDESLVDSLPLRRGDEEGEGQGQMITQFEMGDLERMGYIKFDILTLRTLDTIQNCVDLIEEKRGHRVNIHQWVDEYHDPMVWDTLSDGLTLGVFQVETASGTRLIQRIRPSNMNEFADVLTLVRPGPKRAGLTDLYIERRDGDSEVIYPDPRLEPVLSKTYGCLLYQEDIMETCKVLAGYTLSEADTVRSILGKKKVEKVQAAGEKFVEGCVVHGMDRQAAQHLWDQMAEFAKYSFNRAHAYGYAVLAYWTAWLKVHYPVEFFTSVLSTVKEERIPEFVNEARRMGFSILPPDINESSTSFTAHGLGVRYGLKAISGLGDAACEKILAGQPYSSFEDFQGRSGVDRGVQATLAKIGAFDSLVPNRRGLETMLLMDKTGESARCQFKTDLPNPEHPFNLGCSFDWASEPAPINPRTGKTLKKKDPPKKCTKACRQYLAPAPLDIATIEPYTDVDVRTIEMEVLGLHLSSTPFDQITNVEDREVLTAQAEEIIDGPEGIYLLAVVVNRVRKHIDSNKNEMAFLSLATERSDLDVVVFSKTWEKFRNNLTTGDLRIVEVIKNERGMNLAAVYPVM